MTRALGPVPPRYAYTATLRDLFEEDDLPTEPIPMANNWELVSAVPFVVNGRYLVFFYWRTPLDVPNGTIPTGKRKR